jgi:hypothetical protein
MTENDDQLRPRFVPLPSLPLSPEQREALRFEQSIMFKMGFMCGVPQSVKEKRYAAIKALLNEDARY